jgi:hypothetical protein
MDFFIVFLLGGVAGALFWSKGWPMLKAKFPNLWGK